jgi:hypothetical protein
VRGVVESIDSDSDVSFYRALQKRYGTENPALPADAGVS